MSMPTDRPSPRTRKPVGLIDHFAEVPDPRRRKVKHPRVNIIAMAICAVVCGCDDFVMIAEFAERKRHWFAKFLDLSSGIPSHDCFNRVLAAINTAAFSKCLVKFVAELQEFTEGQVDAIDGRTPRRGFDNAAGKAAIHMAGAWASANKMRLGEVVVGSMSNEITAIPALPDILDSSGCLVTIDAMGRQVEIAKDIIGSGADYILAVKDNQPTLRQGIDEFLADEIERAKSTVIVKKTTNSVEHGRVERREYYIASAPKGLPDRARRRGLAAIGMV